MGKKDKKKEPEPEPVVAEPEVSSAAYQRTPLPRLCWFWFRGLNQRGRSAQIFAGEVLIRPVRTNRRGQSLSYIDVSVRVCICLHNKRNYFESAYKHKGSEWVGDESSRRDMVVVHGLCVV